MDRPLSCVHPAHGRVRVDLSRLRHLDARQVEGHAIEVTPGHLLRHLLHEARPYRDDHVAPDALRFMDERLAGEQRLQPLVPPPVLCVEVQQPLVAGEVAELRTRGGRGRGGGGRRRRGRARRADGGAHGNPQLAVEGAHASQRETDGQGSGGDSHGTPGADGRDGGLVLLANRDLEGGGEGGEVLQLRAAQILDQLLRLFAPRPDRDLPRIHREDVDARLQHVPLLLFGRQLQVADDGEVGEHVGLRDAGQARSPVQPDEGEAILEHDASAGDEDVIAVGDDVVGRRERGEQALDEPLVHQDEDAVGNVGEERARLRLGHEGGLALELSFERGDFEGRRGRGR